MMENVEEQMNEFVLLPSILKEAFLVLYDISVFIAVISRHCELVL
jgi:hypothetical protein